jgi:uncharacterized protein YcbK (DUF882 family)/LysM repeat protein
MRLNQDPTMKIFVAAFFMAMMWTAAHTVHARTSDKGVREADVEAKNIKTKIKSETNNKTKPEMKAEAKAEKAEKAEAKSDKVNTKSDKAEAKTKKTKAESDRAEAKGDKAKGGKAQGDKAKGDKAKGDKAQGGKAQGDKAQAKTESKADKAGRPTEHVIVQGETLGKIAKDYGISISDLMAANDLKNGDKIFFGQKLRLPADPKDGVVTKDGVRLRVPKGFTINRIAALYGVTPRAIIRANNMTDPDHLREGDKLLVPGAKQVMVLVPPPPCFKNPITFYRIRTDETLELPVEYCNGKPNADGLKQLSDFIRSIARPTDINLHPRLLTLLQNVSDHYPGKRIEIVSGQRAKKDKGGESYHTKGQALDFRVEGVSNLTLTNYIRTFEKVGVGYYPNSVFIHMDTREKDAYWIDYSEPGEKAIYGRKGLSEDQLREIRDRRKAKTSSHKHTALSADNDAKAETNPDNSGQEALPSVAVSPVEEPTS